MEFAPTNDLVQEQLDRVAASEQFVRSKRLVRFLRFTVKKALEGRADALTEHALGVEVYDRSTDFDPLMDGIVRTEARRLRSKLRAYYRSAGRADPITIGYPIGSYTPEFSSAAPGFLPSTGNVANLIRTRDWSQTPLGPIASWPNSLKSALSLHLRSALPAMILWGPGLVILFNDAFYGLLGEPYRETLGHLFPENLDRDWPQAGAAARRVLRSGESLVIADSRWLMHREGYHDEHYFTTSFSPIMDAEEKMAGVLVLSTQTTRAVISARRERVLRMLSEGMLESKSAAQACNAAMTALQLNPFDVPFAALYLFDEGRQSAQLRGATGTQPGSAVSPLSVGLRSQDSAFLGEALASASPQILQVGDHLGLLPLGPWDVPAREIAVLPLTGLNQSESIGFLIAAANPHQKLNHEYRRFFESVAARIGAMISQARLKEQKTGLESDAARHELTRSSFLAYATDELRTPLTLLLAFLGQMIGNPRLSAENQSKLTAARRNVLRLLKQLTALIDLGRIEAGQMRAVFEPVDLGTLTADLAGMCRSTMERARLRFVVDCPPMQEAAYVDRLMWEKIVLELLLDALDRTIEGEIGIAVRQMGGWIELVVWNTGLGSAAFELPPFLDERSRSGSGLGVTLIRHFAAMLGGSVQLVKEEGKGSKFMVTVPRGKSHLPAEDMAASGASGAAATLLRAYMEEAFRWTAGQRLTLDQAGSANHAPQNATDWRRREIVPRGRRRLVVAISDAGLRSYCRELLSEVHNVETVASGEQALTSALEQPADLLVVDAALGAMTDLALLRTVRADPRISSVPVILISAQFAEEDRLRAFAAGADDYVVKPFTALELLVRVESQLMAADLRKRTEAEQRAAREAAEAQQLVLEAVIEQLPTAVLVADVSSAKFVLKNRKTYEMLGEVAHALRGLEDVRSDIGFHPDGTPYSAEECPIMRATRLGEVIVDEEIIYHLPDGRRLWALSNSYPIRNSQGQHVATVVTLAEKAAAASRETADASAGLRTPNQIDRNCASDLN